jgi:hypothetical protein
MRKMLLGIIFEFNKPQLKKQGKTIILFIYLKAL